MEKETKSAVFGGSCFWCLEPVFEVTRGVEKVLPGYAGGTLEDPTYEEVKTGETGHVEVVKVEYDPSLVTYKELVKLFFASHDATDLNRQMHEPGSQFRSIILYTDDEQKKIAEEVKAELNKLNKNTTKGEIQTEIVPLEKFYEAEKEHQDYFRKNPDESACCSISGSRAEDE